MLAFYSLHVTIGGKPDILTLPSDCYRTMKRRWTKLAVEVLERRDLLAVGDPILLDIPAPQGGNVTAEVIDGTLVIRGDDASNGIVVYQDEDGSCYLQSFQSTINGLRTWPDGNGGFRAIFVTGVTRGIDIDLGQGDDWLGLNGRGLQDVKIVAGAGDDSVNLGVVTIAPAYAVETATIKFPGPATIGGSLFIDAGDGNDLVSPFANVVGNVTILMGAGDDSVVDPVYTVIGIGIEIQSKLVVGGTLSIDLGPDEQDAGWPADWHSDAALVAKVHPDVLEAFDRYAAALRAGEVVPGQEWTWEQQDDGDPAAHFTSDGRLQIEFTYYAGERELIDRLEARGLQIERHANGNGLAYASIQESELALFGNLPPLAEVYLRGLMWRGRLPFEFDNAKGPLDVDGDGAIHPHNVLIVINALNHGNDVSLDARTDLPAGMRVDVNQDGLLTAIDALRIINALILLSNSKATGAFPVSATEEESSHALSADKFFASEELYEGTVRRTRIFGSEF